MIVKAQFRNQKKFIKIPEACFDIFIAEVKEKFSIREDLAVTVTDDTGTEVDKDVFPDLMTTSGLVFVIHVLNDIGPSTPQSSVSLDTDTLSLTSKSSEDSEWLSPKRFRMDGDEASQSLQARDLIKEILQTRPGGANVLKEFEDTGTISDDMRKLMVNILVAHMIETEGRVPNRLTKQKYGLGIITLFPSLRDPQGRTGYRDPPQFSQIHQDFTLLFGSENASRLFERWPTVFKAKVIRLAETLTSTPLLKRLLSSTKENREEQDSPEWDSDISSFLLLLHLLSPQASGRKRTNRISISQAVDHVVVFQKACQSIQEHLEAEENRQPYILASGSSKEAISQFFIAVDKKLIPCQESSSLAAIDELFKVNFVLSISYDLPLKTIYTFLQTAVYRIDVGTTSESPRVKELRAKLLNDV
ncbi:hypothetical protein UPYG_G00175030 [Umbra pygmaea]|uniref:Uncharacterized protein n=1 Tax=Umbra pygmaea TaxID=75934 RepID=A0ABD0XCC7_UMBPY